jgi:signal transduction histidine kinase
MRTELADGLPLIHADRVQLQQVILNLIINAVEALNGARRREVLLRTTTSETGDVIVSVSDSGPGLAPAAINQIFDAFYTTKQSGFGLGLSICRSIIEAHGGTIFADDNGLEGGARITFMLPADTMNVSP